MASTIVPAGGIQSGFPQTGQNRNGKRRLAVDKRCRMRRLDPSSRLQNSAASKAIAAD